MFLQCVGQVHPEDSGHHSPDPHDEASDLDEQAELDDLVPHAVQVGGDELVRVLNHVIKDLGLGHNFLQIRRMSVKKLLYLLVFLRRGPARLCEVQPNQVLK